MKKWTKIRFDKMILKNLVTISLVLTALIGTLGFYIFFLSMYGEDMKIYNVGVLAGVTGGIWGYAMTKLSNFRDRVHNMDEKEFYLPSFYYRLRTLNIIGIIILFILGLILYIQLASFNL